MCIGALDHLLEGAATLGAESGALAVTRLSTWQRKSLVPDRSVCTA